MTQPSPAEISTISGLSLRHNFSWTFFGNIVYAGCQWGMLATFAKLGNPLMVGQYALGLAIAAPIFTFLNLQLRVAQATDANHQYSFSDYLGLRLVTTLTGFAIVVIVAVFTSGETTWIVAIIGLTKGFDAVSDVIFGLWQKNERMDLVAKSIILNGLISLFALVFLLWATGNAIVSLIGSTAASLLILVVFNFVNAEKCEGIRPSFRKNTFLQLIKLSLPLGIAMMLISINVNIPRYFIEYRFGTESLGFYSAIAYLSVAGTTAVSALGQSAIPRLAKYYLSENGIAFRNLLIKMIGIGVLLAITGVLLAMIAGREILTIFYKPEYANYSDTFFWLMLATGFSYISAFLGTGMTAARYFRIQFPLQLSVVMVMVVASALLVPSYGLPGAAWATCLAFAFRLVLESMVVIHSINSVIRRQKVILQ